MVVSTGLICITSVGLLGRFALTTPSTPARTLQDQRPQQQAVCEKLAKDKLVFPASYQLVSRFSEIQDNGAQRTFRWTFSGRNRNGGTRQAVATCKANNYMSMATIEIKPVDEIKPVE